MNPLHVIEEIPSAWEPIVLLGTITVLEIAQVGLGSMSVHPVGFSFMAEQASSRRELNLGATV